jgi:hypothetical protein
MKKQLLILFTVFVITKLDAQSHNGFAFYGAQQFSPTTTLIVPNLDDLYLKLRAEIRAIDEFKRGIFKASSFTILSVYSSNRYSKSSQKNYKNAAVENVIQSYEKNVALFIKNYRDPFEYSLINSLSSPQDFLNRLRLLNEKTKSENWLKADTFLEIAATKEVALKFLKLKNMSSEMKKEIISEMKKLNLFYSQKMKVKKFQLMPEIFRYQST